MLDPRTSERVIAPFISQEVDGRNLVNYSFGRVVDFETSRSEYSGPAGYFFDKVMYLPFSNIVGVELVFNVSFASMDPVEGAWTIFSDERVVNKMPLSLSGGVDSFSFATTFSTGEQVLIRQHFSVPDNVLVEVEASVVVRVSFNRRVLSSNLLGANVFYVKELRLKPGDAVFFESFTSYFENFGLVDRVYDFSSLPVAVRELTFVKGSPEVVIYFLRGNASLSEVMRE